MIRSAVAAAPSSLRGEGAHSPGDAGANYPALAERTPHELWPTPREEDLLRAAIGDGDEAREAWRRWCEGGAPERADRTSRNIFPRLAANLARLGVHHPFLAGLEEARAATAERNRRHLATVADVVRRLEAAGVPALALKGVALLVSGIEDPADRPMSDIDLLVRPADVVRASAALRAAGWSTRACPSRLRPYLKAFDFEHADGRRRIDLHQYLTDYGSTPEAEAALWSRASRRDLEGAPVLVPDPADLLLQVCAGGLRVYRFRNLRWVVDAHAILAKEGARIDWRAFVAQARARRMVLPLRDCLVTLAAGFRLPVAKGALDALRRAHASRADLRRYRVLASQERSLRRLVEKTLELYRFGARATRGSGRALALLPFVVSLTWWLWDLEGPGGIPAEAARRLRAALAGGRGGGPSGGASGEG
jgi:hypothetical protein